MGVCSLCAISGSAEIKKVLNNLVTVYNSLSLLRSRLHLHEHRYICVYAIVYTYCATIYTVIRNNVRTCVHIHKLQNRCMPICIGKLGFLKLLLSMTLVCMHVCACASLSVPVSVHPINN